MHKPNRNHMVTFSTVSVLLCFFGEVSWGSMHNIRAIEFTRVISFSGRRLPLLVSILLGISEGYTCTPVGLFYPHLEESCLS